MPIQLDRMNQPYNSYLLQNDNTARREAGLCTCGQLRREASAVFPVGFAFFAEGAEAFLGIFEAVEFVEEDVHGIAQAIA